MSFELTKEKLDRARAEGTKQAQAELRRGYETELSDIWSKKDRNDVLFMLTGTKLSAGSYEAEQLTDEYENGYYETWEDAVER